MQHPDNFKLPTTVDLENPLVITLEKLAEGRKKFFALARTRINHRSYDEQVLYEKSLYGSAYKSPHNLIFTVGFKRNKEDTAAFLTGLEISVNDGLVGEKWHDIFPYLLDHEVYEAWLTVKPGKRPSNPHLLARRREFLMATRHGLADRLMEHLLAVGGELVRKECEEAYKRANKLLT